LNSDLVAGVAPKSSRYGSEMKRERESKETSEE